MTPPDRTLPTLLRQPRIVPAVLLAVALLAFVNWMLTPDEPMRWLPAMLILLAVWLGMTLWRWLTVRSLHRRGIDDEGAAMRYAGSAIALVVIAVGFKQIVWFGLRIWNELGGHPSDVEAERRVLGLASSAVLLILGNALPKILTPWSMLPRERAHLVSLARRFIGTTLVILGLATAVAFVSAPLALARTLLQWARGLCLLTILGAIVWMNLRAARLEG